MSNPVIFKDLPATFPEEDKHKGPAAIGSVAIHIAFVTTLILVPLLLPQHIEQWQLMTMITPLPPPPPPAPAPLQVQNSPEPAVPQIQRIIKVEPGTIITPTEIPKEIARIIEEPVAPQTDGVVGGVLNGSASGVLRGLLESVRPVEPHVPPPPVAPPPPPSPPPVSAPATPIRVGGAIQEPRVLRVVPPVYPKLAIKAHVKGTVIMEATVTAEGTVEDIRVISGHPLLVQAAIDCVKQWRYEPTYLNGEPIAVILTAKINFEIGPQS